VTIRRKEMTPEDRAFYKALGERLIKQREKIGLTQAEVAAALRIAQQTYAAYETGTHRVPVVLLEKLAEILATDVHYLLGSVPSSKSVRAKRR
jgi:transcriptional regulator with XRE-family HTH domain